MRSRQPDAEQWRMEWRSLGRPIRQHGDHSPKRSRQRQGVRELRFR
ncbi:MAG: hypothetical protein GEV06_28545 [Luteitalea sp.]|nr:hypothetical protein [Luteitalea sp.]MPZ92574.1 hypothetical protein [Actinomycetota bacterium]